MSAGNVVVGGDNVYALFLHVVLCYSGILSERVHEEAFVCDF